MSALVSGEADFGRNGFEDAIGVAHDFVVPESDHAVSVGFEGRTPSRIGLDRMLSAIAFNDDPQAAAGKVNHVTANRKLPRELHTHLPAAQVGPQHTFRIRHLAPQFARGASEPLFRHLRTPIPNPFPQGKGLSIAKAA